MGIIKKIKEMSLEMTRWRHRLHAEPELAFEERKTARFLNRQLQTFRLDDVQTLAKTGVVGVLHGKSGPGGPAIMLRADMDALPMQEKTGVLHQSRTPGVHHACGHDGHMAMLLGAAKHLAETRNFEGTVYFVFQPAEEHIGGAQEMIKDGLFTKFPADAIYGLHNFPDLPLGTMATGAGPMLAANDDFHVTFKGTGGHSARAGNTTDVIAAAAEAILAIKAMAKAEIPADTTAAVTVCGLFTEGEANNVIPDSISFNGSVRSFDPELHKNLKQKMQDIAQQSAQKYGVDLELDFENGYPVLVNTQDETNFAVEVAKETVGDKAVITQVPPTLGVEDFAFYLQKKPGNFMAIGTGPADGTKAPDIHSAKYDFNDAALPVGASYWVRLVEKALPVGGRPAANNNAAKPAPDHPPAR
ncbi:MAG: amidohydrolase [Bdellovibrionales bacterium]|jgi:hippurate hydrolase|nr:amidohydrolase [Bdellovibrionales bacterium]